MSIILPVLKNAIRALAIVLPALISASYLLKEKPLILIALIITWLIYTAVITCLPIKRRGRYTFVAIVIVTFCNAIIGAILHVDFASHHHLIAKIGAVILGAAALTVGTLLFTLVAWLIFLLFDKQLCWLINRFSAESASHVN